MFLSRTTGCVTLQWITKKDLLICDKKHICELSNVGGSFAQRNISQEETLNYLTTVSDTDFFLPARHRLHHYINFFFPL